MIKIKVNTTIEIKGQVIELTDDELIALRDTLNRLTDHDVLPIQIPQTTPDFPPHNPYVYPYDDGILPYKRVTDNPWINPSRYPVTMFHLEPSSFS